MEAIPPQRLKVMIVAGEPSGDAHAAALVNAMREVTPNDQLDFFGATGPLMRDAGVESVIHSDDLAIVGLLEIGHALPKFWSAFKKLREAALQQKPEAVVLVDWPDFNLRLAHSLHRRGLKVIYYISPQLWAWRSHRVKTIERDVDLMLTILPFERGWYAKQGVTQVEFVGHPLAGEVKARYGREEFCRSHDLDPARPIVSLLPGSRRKELLRILPPMRDAALSISEARPDVQFVVVVAPSRSIEEAKQIIQAGRNTPDETFTIVNQETREALAASDAAALASGTVTLEAALLGTPMVIVYKESAINWNVLGRLITTDHYGLVNLVAGERIVTELMQDELNGERLAAELLLLLEQQRNLKLRKRLHEVAQQLGEGGASRRAAEHILDFLKRSKKDSQV
ncbi:MAG TPA: lipid-A-disaccharide synthase [Pyrinomonadaceae bacterium]|nr:lipid-A-disaccharide synthase [Pyrinomonadaceae bacterium]